MRPICLPLLGEEDADLDGFKMVATGWGKTHDGMFTSNFLVTIITLLLHAILHYFNCLTFYCSIIHESFRV